MKKSSYRDLERPSDNLELYIESGNEFRSVKKFLNTFKGSGAFKEFSDSILYDSERSE